jgi:hypothetical protein
MLFSLRAASGDNERTDHRRHRRAATATSSSIASNGRCAKIAILMSCRRWSAYTT